MAPVWGKNVYTDLPHGVAVRGSARQPDAFAAVVSAYGQHVQLAAFFAERVAPLRQITAGKIRRGQQPYFVGAGKRLYNVGVGQKIFRHKANIAAKILQLIHQDMQIGRFKTVLNRIFLNILRYGFR